MEGRIALSGAAAAVARDGGTVHVAAARQEITVVERQFLDRLNAALDPDLAFSAGAKAAMSRVRFNNKNDVDAYKARCRANTVAFREPASIVVIKGRMSDDLQATVDGVADLLRSLRQRNRVYATHTAAGVIIDPAAGTLRLVTFRPTRPGKPA